MSFLEIPIPATLFLLLFAASVVGYARSRGAVAGAVVLVFAATAPLFVGRLLDYFFGLELPEPLRALSILGLLAQPLLTLRLAALLHPIAQRNLLLALVGYVVTAGPVVALPTPLPPILTQAVVLVYGLTALAAAAYLVAAAGRRTGSARARLHIAAAGAALMAVALLLAAAAAYVPNGSAEVGAAGRYAVLLAASAYAVAFLTPRWLRRIWQARTSFELSRRLLSASAEADASVTWQRFAELAASVAGVTGAAVLVGSPDRGGRAVARVGDVSIDDRQWDGAAFGRLLDRAESAHQLSVDGAPADISDLVAGSSARFVTLVAFPAARDERGLLLLAGQRRSLFGHDDREMFELLGVEAGMLADRAQTVAERTELAQRLTETVEALSSANEAKSDFLASMSHELRTPLNAILGFSDLMLNEPAADGRHSVRAEWIDHVRTAGQHLLGLINDVLDVAKVDAGRLDLQIEQMDVQASVAEAIAGLRPLAAKKGLTLSTDIAPILIAADRGRLRQMLYNLLSNAIKYTPEGGEVRVEGRVDGTAAHVSVVDNGVGIVPELQDRVFEAFAQVGDPELRQAGTGLGLALTKRLVEAHGGRLELESTAGVGSRFTLVLPLSSSATVRQTADLGTPAAALSSTLRDSLPPEGLKVLVIEDDMHAIALVREYLETAGYELLTAEDGVEGIAAARRHRPDAILLDVQLPGLDGWEVLRRLKADPELRRIPVLMVTVVDQQDLGMALGAVDYLVKPLKRDALLSALRRHVAVVPSERRPRILVVDDDPAALDFVQSTLETQGCDVSLAGGGREGVLAASEHDFDLIICDLIMPEVDGFEVVAQLKAADRTRDVPILILTAQTLDAAEKQRFNGKIVGICQKGDQAMVQLREWLTTVPVAAGREPAA